MAEDLTQPYFGNPNVARQGARARELAQQRNAESLPDPRTYGFTQGLFGTSPDQLGMSVLSPNTAPAKEAAYYGNQLGNALGVMPLVEQVGVTAAAIKGAKAFREAQAANTFNRNSSGYGFGRLVGYPQEAGTPVDRLFSNFADNLKTDAAKERFREDMLKRAASFPESKNNISSSFDFKSFNGTLETNPRTGATRVLIKDGEKTVAAAKMDKGMVDSIAVSPEYKGKSIGADLLRFIDDSKIGNIYEVPDRSPGFVKIQKEVLAERGVPLTKPVESVTNPAYQDPMGFTIK
jgi:ribosomal protein S18 acetylase RimI-like enzyme